MLGARRTRRYWGLGGRGNAGTGRTGRYWEWGGQGNAGDQEDATMLGTGRMGRCWGLGGWAESNGKRLKSGGAAVGLGCSSAKGRGPLSAPHRACPGGCCSVLAAQAPPALTGRFLGCFPSISVCLRDQQGQFKAASISRLLSGSFVNQTGDK